MKLILSLFLAIMAMTAAVLTSMPLRADTRFASATDATGNNRGEIRWIVQDDGAQTYYIYFDITQNGVKPTNAQPKINANFEHGSTGRTLGLSVPSLGAGVRQSFTYDVYDVTVVN